MIIVSILFLRGHFEWLNASETIMKLESINTEAMLIVADNPL